MGRHTPPTGSLLPALIILCTSSLPRAHADPIRWKDLFGVHYTADRPDAGMARGLPLHSWGWPCDVTDAEHDGIEPFTGPFSGGPRFHDFTGRYTGRRNIFDAVRHAGEMRVPILAPCNIVNQPAELRKMLAEDGVYWKDLVYHSVRTFNSGEFADRPVLHWQLGNEINGVSHFNIRMVDEELTKGAARWREFNRDEQLDAYVELHFAPTAEAILRAARDVYGEDSPIKLVLGSVANFRNPQGRAWLDKLLETEIKGDRAPSLKGKRVWEVADIISFHYLVTAAPPEWPEVLDGLYEQWIASGRIEGMWATEEHGASGRGAVTTARTALRWLSWWCRQPWQMDRGRVFMWGDDRQKPGGPGRLGTQILHAFFGDRPIDNARGLDIRVPDASDLETYAFECSPDARLIALWPRDPDASPTIDQILVGETPRSTRVQCILLSNTRPPASIPIQQADGDDPSSFRLKSPLQLRPGHEDTILLLLGSPALNLPQLSAAPAAN